MENEKIIICNGCGEEVPHVGYCHEILWHVHDRFPELCGYGIEVDAPEQPKEE